jgi:hypothetical protein
LEEVTGVIEYTAGYDLQDWKFTLCIIWQQAILYLSFLKDAQNIYHLRRKIMK